MLYRYCISIALVAIMFSGAHAERVLTRVIDVEQSGAHEVVLDAGRLDGLREGARVTLLREGEAIVHPLTGEILGIPQEPVGLAEVKGLQDRRARAIMVKSYSMPQVGDLAEYGKVPMAAAATQPAPVEVAKVIKRVKTLEAGMQQYKKSQKSLSAYPVFAQQVWDEMGTIKSYLVALDERLIELETQQHEDREHCEVFPQLAFAQRVLDIFDNVELDVAVAQNFQRAIGFPSVGVVVDGYFFHDVSVLNVKKIDFTNIYSKFY